MLVICLNEVSYNQETSFDFISPLSTNSYIKKNFLFIGHPDAGWHSAVIYSVLGSCSRLGIDPHAYLEDVLRRLPDMKISQIPQITPAAWAKARKAAARQKSN